MRESSKIAAAISIDIKGAFDHLEREGFKRELYANYLRNCADTISSYLSDRKICYFGVTMALDRGCPQGGVISGPWWNMGYNPIQRFLESKLIQHFCYADHTMILDGG